MRVEPGQAEVSLYTWGTKIERAFTPVAAYVINVAGLRDPQSNRGFNKKYSHGLPGEIQEFVKEDSRIPAIADTVRMLAHLYLRSDRHTSKWLSIAIVDHHGRWIAPAVGELMAHELINAGFRVSLFHYDIKEVK